MLSSRAFEGGADPFDMSGLSDAERAAMRQEWSLECRRAGLDHLAESFKKPSVLNPRDDDVLPFTDPRNHPNPIASVVAGVSLSAALICEGSRRDRVLPVD